MDVPTCKLFSIDEANALIPYLENALDNLQQRVREIVCLKRQLEVLQLVCSADLTHDNPDFQEFTEKTGLYHQQIGEADGLIRDIRVKGCLLRDVHTGIVDFYTRYNGRVVYLCWRKGEKRITHWHPIGEGFGKRRLLAGENRPADNM
jgi:hypothetical protein